MLIWTTEDLETSLRPINSASTSDNSVALDVAPLTIGLLARQRHRRASTSNTLRWTSADVLFCRDQSDPRGSGRSLNVETKSPTAPCRADDYALPVVGQVIEPVGRGSRLGIG